MRAWLFAPLLVACGGSIADPIEGGSADATTDAIVTDVPAPKMDAPVTIDCNTLKAKLDAARTQVITCCPICQSIQCSHVTQDVCCPISTTATDVTAFEQLVADYKAQCNPACPAIPCPPVPSNTCIPGANKNDPGTCK